jgi:hypothetical protein
MNFNCGIKSISISSNAKKVYEELDIIRPKHISFSLMLAITADEYIKNHKKGLVKLDDFTCNEVSSSIPNFLADIEDWAGYITSIDDEQVKSLQQRILQLQNIMDQRDGRANLY